VTIQPYLYFAGRAEEAITFYQKVFGAELQMLLRFKDSPDPVPVGMIAPGWENKVMHSSLKIGESIVLASDGCGSAAAGFKGFGLSYAVKDAAEADRIFAALAEAGAP
jgi:PhnB protein